MRVLGFMTGTSLDAVDMAVLDVEGGEIRGFGPAGVWSGSIRDDPGLGLEAGLGPGVVGGGSGRGGAGGSLGLDQHRI